MRFRLAEIPFGVGVLVFVATCCDLRALSVEFCALERTGSLAGLAGTLRFLCFVFLRLFFDLVFPVKPTFLPFAELVLLVEPIFLPFAELVFLAEPTLPTFALQDLLCLAVLVFRTVSVLLDVLLFTKSTFSTFLFYTYLSSSNILFFDAFG